MTLPWRGPAPDGTSAGSGTVRVALLLPARQAALPAEGFPQPPRQHDSAVVGALLARTAGASVGVMRDLPAEGREPLQRGVLDIDFELVQQFLFTRLDKIESLHAGASTSAFGRPRPAGLGRGMYQGDVRAPQGAKPHWTKVSGGIASIIVGCLSPLIGDLLAVRFHAPARNLRHPAFPGVGGVPATCAHLQPARVQHTHDNIGGRDPLRQHDGVERVPEAHGELTLPGSPGAVGLGTAERKRVAARVVQARRRQGYRLTDGLRLVGLVGHLVPRARSRGAPSGRWWWPIAVGGAVAAFLFWYAWLLRGEGGGDSAVGIAWGLSLIVGVWGVVTAAVGVWIRKGDVTGAPGPTVVAIEGEGEPGERMHALVVAFGIVFVAVARLTPGRPARGARRVPQAPSGCSASGAARTPPHRGATRKPYVRVPRESFLPLEKRRHGLL